MLLQLCTRNPCKLKGTQAGRKRPIISGEDFPATWKWTNTETDTLEGGSFLMRWTLFLIYFWKIFDEHLQFVNIS